MFILNRQLDAEINKTHISLYLIISFSSHLSASNKQSFWFSIKYVGIAYRNESPAFFVESKKRVQNIFFKVLWALNLSRIRPSDKFESSHFECHSLNALIATERQLTAHGSDTSFYSEHFRKENQQIRCSDENSFENKLRRSYWFRSVAHCSRRIMESGEKS